MQNLGANATTCCVAGGGLRCVRASAMRGMQGIHEPSHEVHRRGTQIFVRLLRQHHADAARVCGAHRPRRPAQGCRRAPRAQQRLSGICGPCSVHGGPPWTFMALQQVRMASVDFHGLALESNGWQQKTSVVHASHLDFASQRLARFAFPLLQLAVVQALVYTDNLQSFVHPCCRCDRQCCPRTSSS